MMILRNVLLVTFFLAGSITYANGEKEDRTSITTMWSKEKQKIEGFGIAQAGWSDQLFLFKNRNKVLDAMFGEEGLRLNILRGEVFPHYSTNPGEVNFTLYNDTICPMISDSIDSKELLRIGQWWLTSTVAKHYHVDKFIFSTWSPPAWMKDNKNVSGGKLEEKNYQQFADYLADFYDAYHNKGINIYGISPSNEPGYPATWNSCVWSADEMGKFASEFLGPTLKKRHIEAKMILGENPLWSVVFPLLKPMSSVDFVQTIVTNYPKVLSYKPIFAGHGYSLPDTLKKLPKEMLKTPIIPMFDAKDHELSTWVTEISDITPLDISMKDGLAWAKTFHNYLSVANVNAIVWWAGAQPTSNNESLIILDKDRLHFSIAKRYDVFGNYSRYIPINSSRIENQCSNPNIQVTTYKKGDTCIWVIINDNSMAENILLSIDKGKSIKKLCSYCTNQEKQWEKQNEKVSKGKGVISIPPKSVVTYVGLVK